MSVPAALGSLVLAAGTVVLGASAPASAEPAICSDPVARVIHLGHETAGPAGEPVHVVEGVYCAVTPL